MRKVLKRLSAILLIVGLTLPVIAFAGGNIYHSNSITLNVRVTPAPEPSDTPASTDETLGPSDTPASTDEILGPSDSPASTDETPGPSDTPASTDETPGPSDSPASTDIALPDDFKVEITAQTQMQGTEPAYGDLVTMTAVITGAPERPLFLQWEQLKDGQWVAAEGETSLTLTFALDETTSGSEWRLRVVVQ